VRQAPASAARLLFEVASLQQLSSLIIRNVIHLRPYHSFKQPGKPQLDRQQPAIAVLCLAALWVLARRSSVIQCSVM
jgi:hypothetical protein